MQQEATHLLCVPQRRKLVCLLAIVCFCALLILPVQRAYADTGYCSYCGRITTGTYYYPASEGCYSPTCTTEGLGILVCDVCGQGNRPQPTPALGHAYQFSYNSATCTQAGSAVYTCSRCGDSYSEPTAAFGHSYYLAEEEEPTCTEEGKKTYTCSRCWNTYTEISEALGHDYERTKTDPTCTQAGYEIDVCRRCNATTKREIAPLGHAWPDEWIVETEPTAFDEGLEYRECKRCGEREEQVLPPLPLLETNFGRGLLLGLLVIVGGAIYAVRRFLAARVLAKAQPNGLDLIALTERKIFAKLSSDEENESFLAVVKSRPNLALVLFDSTKDASLTAQIAAAEPDAVLLDCAGEAGFDEMLETINTLRADHEGVKFEAIVGRADEALSSKLAAEKEAGTLFAYAEAGQNKYVKMARLIVPLYKDFMKDANSLESIGVIADLFGIPAVSTMLGAVVDAKHTKEVAETVKDAFSGEDMELEDGLSVVGYIADLLEFDVASTLVGLAEDALAVRDSVQQEEAGAAHQHYTAATAANNAREAFEKLIK